MTRLPNYKLIFDANTYFSAIAFPDSKLAYLVKKTIESKNFTVVYSEQIREETTRKLIEKKDIPLAKINKLFNQLYYSKQTLNKSRSPSELRDANDWHLFALAFFLEAEFLVTGDKDILAFQPQWKKTRIMKLSEFATFLESTDNSI